jgi:hypothetical protein
LGIYSCSIAGQFEWNSAIDKQFPDGTKIVAVGSERDIRSGKGGDRVDVGELGNCGINDKGT